MSIIRIFVGKNNFKEDDKHPDIIISQMVETGELDANQRPVSKFVKIGGAWKSKNGKPSYTGTINLDDIKDAGKTTAAPKKQDEDDTFGPF